MDLAELQSELTVDPLGRGYAGMDAAQAAASLNTPNRSRFIAISGPALLRWAAAGADVANNIPARIVRIKLASERAAPFDGLNFVAQGYAAAAVAAINASMPLSYDDATVRDMIAQLATDGVLTSGEADDLAALGTETISRAAELGLGTVKAGHIEQARA